MVSILNMKMSFSLQLNIYKTKNSYNIYNHIGFKKIVKSNWQSLTNDFLNNQ